MSEQEEDFAAMFEASVKARQFERGQTIEGTIVAIGPKVAFVNVGGKGEAEIDLAELKDADGDVEVSVGDRIQAMVVSTSGGIVLSRKGVRNAATQRELEDAFQAGLAVEGKVEKAVKGGYEVRIARERAFCPLSQIDIVRTADPGGARRPGLRVPHHRVQGRRQGRRRLAAQACSKRSSAPAPRTCASRSCPARCSPAGSPRCSTSAPSSISAAASRACCTSPRWAGRASTNAERDRRARRPDHRQGAARRRGHAEDLARAEAAAWTIRGPRWPTTYEVGQVRTGRVTRVAEFGAFVELEPGIEGAGARLHVSADRPRRRLGQVGARRARPARSRS